MLHKFDGQSRAAASIDKHEKEMEIVYIYSYLFCLFGALTLQCFLSPQMFARNYCLA